MLKSEMNSKTKSLSFGNRLKKDLRRNYRSYILLLPVVAFYLIFCYKPMYGAIIAFKDYRPALGVWDSQWVGLQHFKIFFESPDFPVIIKNTLIISISSIVFVFPTSIILALLFDQLKFKRFKSLAQSVSYLPHFISLVVVCGMIKTFVARGGVIQQLVAAFGGPDAGLLNSPEYFVPIYILSEIWQTVGWSSIIYLAALSGINQDLYEAAQIDGANKWKQVIHVTIPGIMPTIVIMFILKMGSVFNVGYEKIILLYNENIYETSDVINSYVYRVGLTRQSWSYTSAVGIFNSVINLIIIIITNKLADKYTETSLW